MQLINATRMVAGYNVGIEPSGRELLVVVIKGTFVLPRAGETVKLSETQLPLVTADTFGGDPASSAPVREIDFAPRKHACDVLLTGHAHAPAGHQVTRLSVGLRVGPMQKIIEVVGDRVWQMGLGGIGASPPRPFVEMPLCYDRAFGGVDPHDEGNGLHDVYLANPVGRGWRKHLKKASIDGAPLPNTEAPGAAVSAPDGAYAPMALGPLGRGWQSRAGYAGTYDQHWRDEVFPFLPPDFDERYYQAAPQDQQLPFPSGETEVTLSGFTADGPRRFVLPHFEAPVRIVPTRGEPEAHRAVLDTIVFEPDEGRFALTWRLTRPLRKNLFDIAKVVVGREGRALHYAYPPRLPAQAAMSS
jgi:hypothetical protein